MKRQKKKHVIIGAGAVAVLAAVTLIAEGISYFSAETVAVSYTHLTLPTNREV